MANEASLGLLLLLFVALWAVDADRMRSGSQPDVASSLQDPKYIIDFHPSESPVLPTLGQETVLTTDRDGKKFRCNIPVPESTRIVNKDGFQQNGTSNSLVAEELSSRKTPEDLLDAHKDKCFRRYEGWWIYELCYKGLLRQFHLHDKRIVQEFVLGTFDAEATAALHEHSPSVSLQNDPRSQSAAQRYHAHVYTNGTICDLTNQPRETEVRFVCSETGRALINSIKEAPSCKYTVVFHAPMLCKHPAFQEERQPWVVINCNAVPSDVVPVAEDTTSGKPLVETDTPKSVVTAALPLSANETPLPSLPQDDLIPVLGAFTKSEDGIQVLELRKDTPEGIKINEEVTKLSEESHKIEKPAADSKESVEPPAPVEKPVIVGGEEKGEEKGVRKVELAASVEEPATAAEGEEKGEGKAEELALPGHQREDHPAA